MERVSVFAEYFIGSSLEKGPPGVIAPNFSEVHGVYCSSPEAHQFYTIG